MRFLFLAIILNGPSIAGAQLQIGTGAQVQLSGNIQLTLNNTDFVNNGNFSAGTGSVYFTGTAASSISGTQNVQFYNLVLNKNAGVNLSLQRNIGISNQLQFAQGLLNLNANNLNLGTTGLLMGESETSRILGANGGLVMANANLIAPSAVNPGNLGAIISSTQNLGNVVLSRGHQSANGITGGSVLRYYTITPTNNTGLAATLRFQYLDAELNGQTENALTQWRSPDQTNWTYMGYTTRDIAQNYVEKTGIDAFSTWTLSSASSPLPVTFTAFNLQCDGSKVLLRWTTSQEMNSSHFIVEKYNGSSWTGIGNIPAAGNSYTDLHYEFVDYQPVDKALYRIAQYDIDGRMKYTNTAITDCNVTEGVQAWPNPFHQQFIVRINSNRIDQASLRVMDAKGTVVKLQQLNILNGLNQFDVDLQHAAAGTYLAIIELKNSGTVKTIRLVKQ